MKECLVNKLEQWSTVPANSGPNAAPVLSLTSRPHAGFTLLEILLVVVVVAITTAVASQTCSAARASNCALKRGRSSWPWNAARDEAALGAA